VQDEPRQDGLPHLQGVQAVWHLLTCAGSEPHHGLDRSSDFSQNKAFHKPVKNGGNMKRRFPALAFDPALREDSD